MRARAVVLAVAIVMAPLGARAADLVVWWEKGAYAQEDDAVREIIAAFEQASGKQVELVLHPYGELPGKIEVGLKAGGLPDFAMAQEFFDYTAQWALDDRLVDLTGAVGHFSDLFDPDALAWATPLDRETGQKALYALPVGLSTNHIFVWTSLLAGCGNKAIVWLVSVFCDVE